MEKRKFYFCVEKDNVWKCPLKCGKTFKCLFSLKQHLFTKLIACNVGGVTEEGWHICYFCQKSFKHRLKLERHYKKYFFYYKNPELEVSKRFIARFGNDISLVKAAMEETVIAKKRYLMSIGKIKKCPKGCGKYVRTSNMPTHLKNQHGESGSVPQNLRRLHFIEQHRKKLYGASNPAKVYHKIENLVAKMKEQKQKHLRKLEKLNSKKSIIFAIQKKNN